MICRFVTKIQKPFSDFSGAYAPDCDTQGFYKSTQCHNSVGVCWCVDKHGVEFANTRTRGKPSCGNFRIRIKLHEFVLKKNLIGCTDDVINNAESLTSDDEDDETDDEDTSEGSADNLLIF